MRKQSIWDLAFAVVLIMYSFLWQRWDSAFPLPTPHSTAFWFPLIWGHQEGGVSDTYPADASARTVLRWRRTFPPGSPHWKGKQEISKGRTQGWAFPLVVQSASGCIRPALGRAPWVHLGPVPLLFLSVGLTMWSLHQQHHQYPLDTC